MLLSTLRTFVRRFVAPLAILGACLSAPCAHAAENRLQVHPFPDPIRYSHHNDDYTVRVRVPGGAWQDLYEYNVKVDLDKPQDASMVYFNFDGTVEVAVQKNNGMFSKVTVRPDAKGVKPAVRDGIVYFTMRRPDNLSVEFDDDHLHNLHVFTHAIRADMPAVPANLSSNDIGTGTTPEEDLTAGATSETLCHDAPRPDRSDDDRFRRVDGRDERDERARGHARSRARKRRSRAGERRSRARQRMEEEG